MVDFLSDVQKLRYNVCLALKNTPKLQVTQYIISFLCESNSGLKTNKINGGDINFSYSDDHFTIYTHIKSLHSTPEMNIMLYVSYTSI